MPVINRNSAAPIYDTLADAIAGNMRVGQQCIVQNNTGTDDVTTNYKVVANGSGGIAMNNGNELLGFGYDKVDSISQLPPATGSGRKVSVTGYHAGTTVGGGEFVDAGLARHNGGTFIDPDRAFPTDWADPVQVDAWFLDSDVDVPCWERLDIDVLNPEVFGAYGDYNEATDTGTNDQPAIQALANAVSTMKSVVITLPRAYYLDSKYDSNYTLYFAGMESLTITAFGWSNILRNSDNLNTHCVGGDNIPAVNISGFSIFGADPNIYAYGHRHINLNFCEDISITNMRLVGSGRYSIAHQNGTCQRFNISDIYFKNIGNDCIDVKNTEWPTDSTQNFTISNLIVEDFGINSAVGFPPHQVVDCRAPVVVNNIAVNYLRENCSVVRLFGDAIGSQINNIRAADGVDPTTLNSNNATMIVKVDGQAYATNSNKYSNITNIYGKNLYYGVRVLEGASKVNISNGSLVGCYRAIRSGTTESNINVSNVHFENSIDADVFCDSPDCSVTFCSSEGCDTFVDGSSFTERFRMIGNTLSNDVTTAQNLPPSALATAVIFGNTGVDEQMFLPIPENYANDSAAASGGIPVGGIYRNGSILQIRVS